MDFVSHVGNVVKCFEHGYGQSVKAYTGKGMSAAEKADVAKRFRYLAIHYTS